MKYGILIFFTFFLLFSCVSGSQTVQVVDEVTVNILMRPRFNKAAIRPLGHVLLSWTAVESVSGYELQMSDSVDFTNIRQTWTLNNNHIELPFDSQIIRWYRVRSFIPEELSNWSEIFRLDPKEL